MATEDGTRGFNGTVTTLLDEFLRNNTTPFNHLYTCGPEPMMSKIVEISNNYQIPVQLSMERAMGCGVGACLGCTCETTEDQEPSHKEYKHVCTDGPVFNGEEVILDA